MPRPALLLLLLLAVTGASCAGQGETTMAVRPHREMPGGMEGPSIVDNVGTSAVVEFTSGVATVCNVAFGTDPAYGALATMPMMGGAVREHAVSLTGLTPNTAYHYRITLTDEQARVYQSEDITFTTAPREA